MAVLAVFITSFNLYICVLSCQPHMVPRAICLPYADYCRHLHMADHTFMLILSVCALLLHL